MPNAVTICSNALQILGADPISSFEDGTDNAGRCSNLYPTVRDSVLRAHSWNCATRRVLLSPLSAAPAFDFSHQFQIPGDWLRTLQVGYKGRTIPYRHEAQALLANVAALPLVYCWRNKVESTWSANLIHLVELEMAAKMAYAVTSSASMRDSMRDEAMRAFKLAKAVDGQDDPPEEFEEGSFVESRY